MRQVINSARHYALAIYAVVAVGLGILIEGFLIAPILFYSRHFGFWPGMVVFTLTWLLIGLVVLVTTVRYWPQKIEAATEDLSNGPVRRRIGALARHSRPLGAFAVALYFGPIMSPPFFRSLGYRDRGLALWVVASALIFCPVWFTFYGGGMHVLVSFFGDR